jgi:DNA-binding winged helix-turn-helix (wHTH) protein
MRYRFAGFTLDVDSRALSDASQAIRLSPKAYELLVYLVEKSPAAASRQEIYDHLWPQTFVDASSLHTQVHDLRRAIGDKERSLIRNVYGYGLILGAPVTHADRAGPAQFHLVIGDLVFNLKAGDNLVGRDHDCDVRIDFPSVSRHHARIAITGDGASIADLGSKNGTQVGERRLRAPAMLQHGDRVLFGSISAIIRAVKPLAPTVTAP